MANRFVDDQELQTIDLGDGDWVKIPKQLSYGFVAEISKYQGDNVAAATHTLLALLKEWNLKDSSGNIPEINEKNIRSLDMESISIIMKAIEPMVTIDPKG